MLALVRDDAWRTIPLSGRRMRTAVGRLFEKRAAITGARFCVARARRRTVRSRSGRWQHRRDHRWRVGLYPSSARASRRRYEAAIPRVVPTGKPADWTKLRERRRIRPGTRSLLLAGRRANRPAHLGNHRARPRTSISIRVPVGLQRLVPETYSHGLPGPVTRRARASVHRQHRRGRHRDQAQHERRRPRREAGDARVGPGVADEWRRIRLQHRRHACRGVLAADDEVSPCSRIRAWVASRRSWARPRAPHAEALGVAVLRQRRPVGCCGVRGRQASVNGRRSRFPARDDIRFDPAGDSVFVVPSEPLCSAWPSLDWRNGQLPQRRSTMAACDLVDVRGQRSDGRGAGTATSQGRLVVRRARGAAVDDRRRQLSPPRFRRPGNCCWSEPGPGRDREHLVARSQMAPPKKLTNGPIRHVAGFQPRWDSRGCTSTTRSKSIMICATGTNACGSFGGTKCSPRGPASRRTGRRSPT